MTIWPRINRFVGTWYWFLVRNFNFNRVLFSATIATGTISRIGNLVGFIVTIRCAVWFLSYEKIPDLLINFVDAYFYKGGINYFLGVLPPSIFLFFAILQYIFEHLSRLHKSEIVHELSLNNMLKISKKFRQSNESDANTIHAVAHEYRVGNIKFYRIETFFIKLIVSSGVLGCVLLFGIIINPILVGSISAIGIIFGIFVMFKRYDDAQALELQKKEQNLEEIQAAQTIEKPLEEFIIGNKDSGFLISAAAPLKGVAAKARTREEVFKSGTLLVINVGQAAIILFFFLLLINGQNNDIRIGYLAAILFTIRFSLSLIQDIIALTIELSKNYNFVFNSRDPKTVSVHL